VSTLYGRGGGAFPSGAHTALPWCSWSHFLCARAAVALTGAARGAAAESGATLTSPRGLRASPHGGPRAYSPPPPSHTQSDWLSSPPDDATESALSASDVRLSTMSALLAEGGALGMGSRGGPVLLVAADEVAASVARAASFRAAFVQAEPGERPQALVDYRVWWRCVEREAPPPPTSVQSGHVSSIPLY